MAQHPSPNWQNLSRHIAAALFCLALSACGGGGGGGSAAAPVTTVTAATGLSEFTPSGVPPENYLAMQAVPFSSIQAAALNLPASSRPSYLKIWLIDPATQEPVLLSLGVWDPSVTPQPVHPPKAVSVIYFEIYNDAGSVSGEWSIS